MEENKLAERKAFLNQQLKNLQNYELKLQMSIQLMMNEYLSLKHLI